MLYVCVRGVIDVVFSVCIVTRGAVGARNLLTCGCSAASTWKPGPHTVSTIVK